MYSGKHPQDVSLSKALSWLLRHGALREQMSISDEGYISVNSILNHKSFRRYSLVDIQRVVENQDKQRLSLRRNPVSNELEIKANHGHSFNVQNLQLVPLEITESTVVVHGTFLKSWDKIKKEGLSRMKRTHIHFACGAPGDPSFERGIRSDCNVLIFMNVQKLLEGKNSFSMKRL
ncbi:tRNA 2'-phosphotransferase 1-like isoform X3 [Ischnura elegans]|uniref:tRNA 2'-phosphotransferase 1-like isoform X3 n=1 Tax=Ischnura elegans TaxID=197161 RepID=UPI001ED892F1|nr:tRNA 2'-phosphotransferase 1-like isoform X3 [Ischnura elegans]